MEIDAAAHPSIREKHGGEAVSNGGAVVEEDTTVDLFTLLLRPSPYAVESGSLALGTFEHGSDLVDLVQESAKVLVVGAGGLGCEILKNLSLSGIKVSRGQAGVDLSCGGCKWWQEVRVGGVGDR